MHRHVLFLPRAGNLNGLKMRQEPVGVPTSGSVRVKISHSGLNLADVFACLGLYSATPTGEFIPGLEFSGIVEQVGTPTSELRPGDRVWGFSRFGAYASHIDADPRYLRKIPDTWSLAEAAAFPVQALTAWYGLVELGALHAGQGVLVQSAAGGVGLHALQIVQWKQAHAIAVIGRPEKADLLMKEFGLSADQIVLRPSGWRAGAEFGRRLDDAMGPSGRQLDLVLDAVAGPFFRPAFERLAPGGRYLLFGAADFMPTGSRRGWLRLAYQYMKRYRPDPLSMISDNRAVFGFNLIWLYDRVDEMAAMLGPMMQLPWRRPVIDSIFPAAKAFDALQHLKSGRTTGKVLLEWE
ncbi:MAG: zinc-binding dehydrogenase [Spirochaetae bacterium HGW-Spirochaetae-10]|nr:MAG: zinc-binding dehydrogenase [Spirochaetae bacterium HGW-Spirochaetae-10]